MFANSEEIQGANIASQCRVRGVTCGALKMKTDVLRRLRPMFLEQLELRREGTALSTDRLSAGRQRRMLAL